MRPRLLAVVELQVKAAVLAAFVAFTGRFEGIVPFMYLDIKGLVTTAIGNLIDSPEAASALPWLHADGSPASRQEIADEWFAVKARQEMAPRGGLAFRAVTHLHLDAGGIAKVVSGKLAANAAYLLHRFPDFNAWPADAQLGILSMAWACGPGFHFPRFEAAIARRDWAQASVECHMNDAGNPGLRPRNLADAVCFMNAAAVDALGSDPEELHYPTQLPAAVPAPPTTRPEGPAA